jgi:hypothetical protein
MGMNTTAKIHPQDLIARNAAKVAGCRYAPGVYVSGELAANRASSMPAHCVVLGDNARYWVVTLADAARLCRAGYEMA